MQLSNMLQYEKNEKVLGFKLPTRKEAKRLLRTAVEHHQFFRLNQPEPVDSSTFGTFGSRRWRMSGRTAAQLKHAGKVFCQSYITCIFCYLVYQHQCNQLLAMMEII